MTIKTIKSFDAACSDSVQSVAAKRLKTEMEIVVLLEGERVRFTAPEHGKGKHSTYSSTHDGVELSNSVVLNGTAFSNTIQHSVIKKAYGSSTDKKHMSTREHEGNSAPSSVTHAPVNSSVQYQTSRAQNDSADEVSTSCFSWIKKNRRRVAQRRQPSSRLNHIGICDDSNVAIVGGYLMGAVVGAAVGLTVSAGVAGTVGAAVGIAAVGAIGTACSNR